MPWGYPICKQVYKGSLYSNTVTGLIALITLFLNKPCYVERYLGDLHTLVNIVHTIVVHLIVLSARWVKMAF